MIVKHFEIQKKDLKDNKFFLLYGKNEGLIQETIEKSLQPILPKNVFNYEEKEILDNINSFKEQLFNKSLFENEKLIIIKRITDKLASLAEELINKNIEDIKIVFIGNVLEKKSKIRNLFEKEKITLIVPFYEDTLQTLNSIAKKILSENKINLSPLFIIPSIDCLISVLDNSLFIQTLYFFSISYFGCIIECANSPSFVTKINPSLK